MEEQINAKMADDKKPQNIEELLCFIRAQAAAYKSK
jgi:hypothetical protein